MLGPTKEANEVSGFVLVGRDQIQFFVECTAPIQIYKSNGKLVFLHAKRYCNIKKFLGVRQLKNTAVFSRYELNPIGFPLQRKHKKGIIGVEQFIFTRVMFYIKRCVSHTTHVLEK